MRKSSCRITTVGLFSIHKRHLAQMDLCHAYSPSHRGFACSIGSSHLQQINPLRVVFLNSQCAMGAWGLSFVNPSITSSREYRCSKEVTEPLTSLISSQSLDSTNLDKVDVLEKKLDLKKQKKSFFVTATLHMLYQQAGPKLQRHLDQARKKVRQLGCWLTALPLKSLNFVLNKQDFQDSIYLW